MHDFVIKCLPHLGKVMAMTLFRLGIDLQLRVGTLFEKVFDLYVQRPTTQFLLTHTHMYVVLHV